MRTILRDPRVRLFYLSGAVSTLGDYALWLALGVWVKLLTGSTGAAGLAFLALTLGGLLSPATGVLVDRLPRKPLTLWTYLATGALLTALLSVHSRSGVWLIYTVTFLYGVSGTVSANAQQALVPQIVDAGHLADANGLQQTLTQGLRLVTPLVGVVVLAYAGAHVVVLIDVASFVLAAALLLAVHITEPAPEASEHHWRRDAMLGFVFIRRTAVLRQLLFAFALAILFVGFYETLGIQIATVGLHHAPTWIGVFVTFQGFGGVAGGILAGPAAKRLGDGMLCAAGLAVLALSTLALELPYDAVALGAGVAMGFALPWAIVGLMTSLQKHTPNAMMGRVMGAADLGLQLPQAVGIALGALLVTVLDYHVLLFMIAGALTVTTVYLATRPEQRASAVPVVVGADGEGAAAGAEGTAAGGAAGGAGDAADTYGVADGGVEPDHAPGTAAGAVGG